jgi:DNA-binding LacI/PurR family transcriptional regulator
MGVLRGALLGGVRVPDELSVVGFDDIPMAKFTVPGLTTVRMPIAAMAAEAVALAVEPGRRDGVPGPRVFPPTLVVRQSTAAPPADEAIAPPTTSEDVPGLVKAVS